MGRFVAVTTAELAAAYRLAGVTTVVVGDPAAAAQAVDDLDRAGERGLIAVHEPFWTALPAVVRQRYAARLSPLVVALPAGPAVDEHETRSEDLRTALAAAVGYEFTFDPDGDTR